jgi:anti-repressor protein
MEKNIQKQLSPMDQLKLQLKVLEEQDKKIEGVSSRISKIEDQMTIETGKQKVLSDLVTEKVMTVLGGKEAPAYMELSKKAFSQCWRDFKRVLNVASYKDTPIKDYDWAIEVIDCWKPSRELELMIMGSNSQVRM